VALVLPPFPFVVGSKRSGTTLLRAMLDASPVLAIPPESQFIPVLAPRAGEAFDVAAFVRELLVLPRLSYWDIDKEVLRSGIMSEPPATYPDAVRRVYAIYAATQGKERYGDKTPGYAGDIDGLAAMFPEAVFIHLIRDGRDVVPAVLDADDWGPTRLVDAAFNWRRIVNAGRASGKRLGPARYVEVRYEDLVADPAPTLERLCAFIDTPVDPVMLHPEARAERVIAGFSRPQTHASLREPITVGLRDWRRDLPRRDVELVEELIGDTLEELGYSRSCTRVSAATRARAANARVARRVREGRSALRRRMTPLVSGRRRRRD
jgi:hypothetical protein